MDMDFQQYRTDLLKSENTACIQRFCIESDLLLDVNCTNSYYHAF